MKPKRHRWVSGGEGQYRVVCEHCGCWYKNARRQDGYHQPNGSITRLAGECMPRESQEGA